MDKTKLMQQLMATFLDEMQEHVRALNRDLLDLERNPEAVERAERFKTLFRTAHSLKGAARSVNISLIEGACHRLEEILAGSRDGNLPLTPELFGLLFATADALEEASMRLREQQDLAEAPLAALLPRLEAAAGALYTSWSPASDLASASPAQSTPIIPEALPREPAHPVWREKRIPAATAVSAPLGQPTPPQSEMFAGSAPAPTSLRVPAEKLDTLLARIGELLVARRRVGSRAQDLGAVQEFVDHWKTEWQRVEKALGKTEKRADGHHDGLPLLSRRATLVLRQAGNNIRHLSKDLERLARAMKGDSRLLEQVATPLDDEVRRVRMLPFAEACAGLDRLVRDLAQADGKEADLRIEGGSVELDRSILEGLKDPLRHLVRNAVAHGLEAPAQRQQAGKAGRGQLVVSAALRGSQVEVVVQDDGRGLDLEALRAQARRRQLPEPANERDLAHLIFHPGLSTAAIITDVSGRGVGLDVVKSHVEALHGTVDLSWTPGMGTRFTLMLPLTLTTLRAVLVRVAGQTVAFAGTNVHKLVRASAAELQSVAGRAVLVLGGPPLPFARLAAVIQSAAPAPTRQDGKIPVLIVAAGEKRMAFAVDEWVAEQEIVIKSLGTRIRQVPLVAGATLLASGEIALVLNAANLIRSALHRAAALSAATETATPAPAARKRLLVVEDSVTTRTLEKSILEAAGYEVATAVDGQAAWQFLQEHEVDLVVSDVEMPNMDGFELTQAVRDSTKLKELPFVLVTSRESDQDKARGIAAGADAYLVKGAFDQRNLLETIAQLL